MRFTTPPFEIDPSDPFKNNALDRKQYALALTNSVSTLKEELVTSPSVSMISESNTKLLLFAENEHHHNNDNTDNG
jgi:hypothetical protein